MFEGLDDIPWADLDHAYGKAGDVPGLIRDLVKTDGAVADAAIHALFGNIWHQGTVYPASAPAVLYLAEALGAISPERRPQVLQLLGSLARGHGHHDVHHHHKLDNRDRHIAAERTAARATTLATFDQWDRIAAQLSAPDRATRLSTICVLSLLGHNDVSEPAPAKWSAPFLGCRPDTHQKGHWAGKVRRLADAALATVADPIELAAWLRALVQIDQVDHPALAFDQIGKHPPVGQFVILSNAACEAMETGAPLPVRFAEPVVALIEASEKILRDHREVGWPWEEMVQPDLLDYAARLDDEGIDTIAEQIAGMIEAGTKWMQFEYQTILDLVLGRPAPRLPDDPCTLSPGRRRIAQAFLNQPVNVDWMWFWHPKNVNATAACKETGVPHDRDVWLRWLGLPSEQRGLIGWLHRILN